MGHEITYPLDLVHSKNGLELPLILAQSGATIQPEQANQILHIYYAYQFFSIDLNHTSRFLLRYTFRRKQAERMSLEIKLYLRISSLRHRGKNIQKYAAFLE